MLRLTLFLLGFLSASALADVPHTFKAGDRVDADKFNKNFETLDQRIDDLIASGSNSSETVPKRVRRIVTNTVSYDDGVPKSALFENTENLRDLVLIRLLNSGCPVSVLGVKVDDKHSFNGTDTVDTFFNTPFENKVMVRCRADRELSSSEREATIEIEYSE